MLRISIILGIVCLCIVGNIRTDQIKGKSHFWGLLACFLLFIFLGVFIIKSSLTAMGYEDSVPSRKILKGLLTQAQSLPSSPVNVIMVDGGSGSARGLNGDTLSRILTNYGYPSVVMQITLAGATHIERFDTHKLFWRQLTKSQRDLISSNNCIFLRELNPGYDSEPLHGFEKNKTSDRTLSYLTVDNAWSCILAGISRNREGIDKSKRLSLKITWDIISCALINYFQVGRVNRIMAAGDMPTLSGYAPLAKPRIIYRGNEELLKTLKELQDGQNPVKAENYAWLSGIRDKRLHDLYGGTFDQSINFLPPCLYNEYIQLAYALAKSSAEPFIVPDKNLYALLDQSAFWYDNGHLLKPGAEIYTRWLAEQLIKTGMLKKGTAPQS